MGLEHEEEDSDSRQSHWETKAVVAIAAPAEIFACLGRPGQVVLHQWEIAAGVVERGGQTGCKTIAGYGSDKDFPR